MAIQASVQETGAVAATPEASPTAAAVAAAPLTPTSAAPAALAAAATAAAAAAVVAAAASAMSATTAGASITTAVPVTSTARSAQNQTLLIPAQPCSHSHDCEAGRTCVDRSRGASDRLPVGQFCKPDARCYCESPGGATNSSGSPGTLPRTAPAASPTGVAVAAAAATTAAAAPAAAAATTAAAAAAAAAAAETTVALSAVAATTAAAPPPPTLPPTPPPPPPTGPVTFLQCGGCSGFGGAWFAPAVGRQQPNLPVLREGSDPPVVAQCITCVCAHTRSLPGAGLRRQRRRH
jgi:hypothetical protein